MNCFSSHQANGNYIVCIDEGNDHVAYLYDWEKGVKLTESNVSTKLKEAPIKFCFFFIRINILILPNFNEF